MDLAQIQSYLAKGGLLIDVRSPEEYSEGHVKNALLIPHTQFFSAEIPAEKDASTLPATGEEASTAAVVLGGVLAAFGLTLAGKRKKED